MNGISGLIAFEIRKKSLGFAYVLWLLFGLFGIHRLYASGAKAFYTQFIFNMVCLVLFFLSILLNLQILAIIMGFIIWLIIPIWLMIDFYFVFRWVKYYNIKLYYELFTEKP